MRQSQQRLAILIATATLAVGTAASTPNVTAGTQDGTVELAMPETAVEFAAEATRYDQEARDLDAKGERHERMAAQYGRRISGGGKQSAALRGIQQHCLRLAKQYRAAAALAREMSASFRRMAVTS